MPISKFNEDVRCIDIFNQHLIGENKIINSLHYNEKINTLAVARKRTIELWNCGHYPVKDCQITGIPNNSTEAVIWCGNTLYSAGFNGYLYQYCVDNLDITEKFIITGGPTWCLSCSQNEEYIAAGTESGAVCIFESNSGSVTFKTLFKQEFRILSLAWHQDNEVLVAGSMNQIYLFDIRTEKVKTISIPNCTENEVSVHAVQILQDFTIVIGDSRGYVSFIDGKLGTHLFASKCHKAPVLCLQKAANDKVVFASGDDSCIAKFQLFRSDVGVMKWIMNILGGCGKSSLNAMAYDNHTNLFFAGGADGYMYRLFETEMANLFIESCPITPPKGYMSLAKKEHCLLLGSAHKIKMMILHDLWRIKEGIVSEQLSELINIPLNINIFLHWISISPKAKTLAYIDTNGLHIVRLHYMKNVAKPRLRNISVDKDVKDCQQIHFLEKNRLITAKNNVVQILRILNDDSRHASVEKTIEVPNGSVRLIVPSDNGKYFAITNSLLDIYVYSAENFECFVLPNKNVLPTAIAFDIPNKSICVAYSNCSIMEFNMVHKKYTEFYSQFIKSNNERCLKKMKLPLSSISYNESDCILLNTLSHLIKINKVENDDSNELNGPLKKKHKNNSNYNPVSLGNVKTKSWEGHLLLYTYLTQSEGLLLEVKKDFIEKTAPKGIKKKIFAYGSI